MQKTTHNRARTPFSVRQGGENFAERYAKTKKACDDKQINTRAKTAYLRFDGARFVVLEVELQLRFAIVAGAA